MEKNIRKEIEAERIRVSREIHDKPAQNLTAALLNIQMVQLLMHKEPEKAGEMLEQAAEMLKECREHFTYSIYEPATIIKTGLEHQIKNYLEKNNTNADFSTAGEIDLSPEEELLRWRVVKELLTLLKDRLRTVNLTFFNLTLSYKGEKADLKNISAMFKSVIFCTEEIDSGFEITVEF